MIYLQLRNILITLRVISCPQDLFRLLCSFQLLLKGASERGAKRICVHILTDGRDVLDGSSVGFVETLENDLSQLREKGIDARIASGGGRMYVTMDRYEVNSYPRIQPSIFMSSGS